MGELIRKENAAPEIRTINGLGEKWAAYIDATPKTVDTYTKALRQFFVWTAGKGITQPSRADILLYRDELKAAHKPATVQLYLAAVKLFFQWTNSEGLYPNVADRIKGAKLDREHKKDYLTSDQSAELLSAVDRTTLKGKRDYALLSLMLTTGLRTVSIIRADIKDIKTAGDGTGLYYQGKGHEDKAEYVKLAPPVEKAIREYLAERGERDTSKALFASEANRNGGERMTTRSVSRIVKGHLTNIGLNSERLTAHSLRHTAATLNLLNGGTIEETQQLLGHANINTTLIYAHALERARNNSENRIAAAIFS